MSKDFSENMAMARDLFSAAGGIAIWLRREEWPRPRCIVRKIIGSPEDALIELAALQIGYQQLVWQVAEMIKADPNELIEKIQIVTKTIEQRFQMTNMVRFPK